MPQICPSPSRQLAAAATAFRKARQRFPRNLGTCACSGDAENDPLPVYPAIGKNGVPAFRNLRAETKTDLNPITDRFCGSDLRGKGNYAWFPSISTSRTALWSQECRKGQRRRVASGLDGISRSEAVCDACGKHRNCSQALPRLILNNDLNEAASKSTHSSVGLKRRRNPKHRRPCIHARGRTTPKIPAEERICLLHGYPAARRRSSIPRKPRNANYCDRKESSLTGGNADARSEEGREKIYRSESQTVADFPTKLQNWEHHTQRGYRGREEGRISRRETVCRKDSETQRNFPNDKTFKFSRNREAMCASCSRQNENSMQGKARKNQESSIKTENPDVEDVCLRPSLIKAAQRKVEPGIGEGRRSCQSSGLCGHSSRSTWDESLNVINHKDSMSILMDRFRGNDKHRSLKLQNICELKSVLGSKTSCGEGGAPQSEKIQSLLTSFDDAESVESQFPSRKSSSGVNPVAKLGRVANQALRESKSRFRNLRNRLNRSGACCSPKGTPWQRGF